MKLRPFLPAIFILFMGTGFVSPVLAGPVTYSSCTVNPPSTYSLQQSLVAQGTGLDYVMTSANAGSTLLVTLPPGATPVTAFLYVEYNNMAFVAPNTTPILFNGTSIGPGTAAGAVSYASWIQTWYNVRYGLNPSLLTAGGTNGSQTAYTANTSANPDTCEGLAVMVLYTDPSQTSTNAVAVADGENAWHLEDNAAIAYGGPPPDAQLDWSCLGLNCANANFHFSSLGGGRGLHGHVR